MANVLPWPRPRVRQRLLPWHCRLPAVQPGLQRSFKDIGEPSIIFREASTSFGKSPKIFVETSKSPKYLHLVHRMLTVSRLLKLITSSQSYDLGKVVECNHCFSHLRTRLFCKAWRKGPQWYDREYLHGMSLQNNFRITMLNREWRAKLLGKRCKTSGYELPDVCL